MDIEVCNFQSIENVKLKVEGFTALVGRSNIGKSALVRAVKTALTNEAGTAFIRHERSTCARMQKGAKTCKCQSSVHVRTEGFDLLWEKSDTVNRYIFNGTTYDKPGHGLPDFLADAGLAPVKIGDDLKSIQFADQFYPIFLLNESGPSVAEALTDVARLDKISLAMKSADKVKRDAVATKKVREKDVLSLDEKLSQYVGLDLACARVDATERSLATLDAKTKSLETLESYLGRSKVLSAGIMALLGISKVKVPSLDEVQAAWEDLSECLRFERELTRRATAYKALLGADKLPTPISIDPLGESLARLKQLNAWEGKLRSLHAVFERLSPVAETSLPQAVDTSKAQAKLTKVIAFQARLKACETSIATLEADLVKVTAEEAAVEAERQAIGICPTCSQPVGSHAHA